MRKVRRPSRPSVYAYIALGGLAILAIEAATLKLVQVWLRLDYGRHINAATLAATIALVIGSCALGWWLADRCRRAALAEKVVEIAELRQRASEAEDRSWWGGGDTPGGTDLEKTVDLKGMPNVHPFRPRSSQAKGTAG